MKLSIPTRALHMIALLAVFALLITGCGSTASPTGVVVAAAPAIAAAPSDAPGALSILEWSGYEDPELWKPFAEQHPDVKVIRPRSTPIIDTPPGSSTLPSSDAV